MMTKFTKLDKDSNCLDLAAVSWCMVKDNLTGLVWEVKTLDDSIHCKDTVFNWKKADKMFIPRINGEKFGGFSDWRLPTTNELLSIVDKDLENPSIDINFFPNTAPSYYWSSVEHVLSDNLIWCVKFSYGLDIFSDKTYEYYVRVL